MWPAPARVLTVLRPAFSSPPGVETVFDLLEMEDEARRELLQMSEPQLEDVARWCNRYPDINVAHQVGGWGVGGGGRRWGPEEAPAAHAA